MLSVVMVTHDFVCGMQTILLALCGTMKLSSQTTQLTVMRKTQAPATAQMKNYRLTLTVRTRTLPAAVKRTMPQEDCSVSNEANIAEVEWFAPAVAASAICNEMSSNLNCPVFKREFRDDPTGNLWPMERLAPCKLASLPHSSHRDNLVVLSRFASFLDQVPKEVV